MRTTFDASEAFKRPDIFHTKYVLTIGISKSVFRFELAQTV
jgi:hypothetical protein